MYTFWVINEELKPSLAMSTSASTDRLDLVCALNSRIEIIESENVRTKDIKII